MKELLRCLWGRIQVMECRIRAYQGISKYIYILLFTSSRHYKDEIKVFFLREREKNDHFPKRKIFFYIILPDLSVCFIYYHQGWHARKSRSPALKGKKSFYSRTPKGWILRGTPKGLLHSNISQTTEFQMDCLPLSNIQVCSLLKLWQSII